MTRQNDSVAFMEYLCLVCQAKFVIVWLTADREVCRCPCCGYDEIKKVAETQGVALAVEDRT